LMTFADRVVCVKLLLVPILIKPPKKQPFHFSLRFPEPDTSFFNFQNFQTAHHIRSQSSRNTYNKQPWISKENTMGPLI